MAEGRTERQLRAARLLLPFETAMHRLLAAILLVAHRHASGNVDRLLVIADCAGGGRDLWRGSDAGAAGDEKRQAQQRGA